MDNFFIKPAARKENVLNQRKGTKRKYKEEYIEYGFIASGSEDAQVPFCLLCNSTLSNESLVPNKLKRHLETNHSAQKNKPREYFEKLATGKGQQSKTLANFRKVTEKGLLASYKVAQLIAQRKKAHTEAELSNYCQNYARI